MTHSLIAPADISPRLPNGHRITPKNETFMPKLSRHAK
jgi:hypothetical protein